MSTIQAWQHIYSNVEKEQSPHRRGGFQTLFYTHAGLSEAEVSEIEGRLLYFPSTVEPVKRLFFTLADGKGVVAQIVVLPEPDQIGRKGRYLAHSLIFSPEALNQFEADPFRVFRRFHFTTTIAEALAQGNFQTGDLPTVALDLPPEPHQEIEAAKAWRAPELKKLALLALQANKQADNRDAVTFAGESDQIENALKAAFLVMPTVARLRCAFDTYFHRCNLVATYFWAIGLPELPAAAKFALVETQQRHIQEYVPLEPATPYQRWVLVVIETGQLAELIRCRDNAWMISDWLEGHEVDSTRLDLALPELITAIFKADPPAVQNLLRSRVGELLPPPLVQRTAEQIYRRTDEITLYQQLRQGLAMPALLEGLYESYAAEQFKTPPRSELKALDKLLETVDYELLRLSMAYWRSPDKDLPTALDQAGEIAYRRFCEIALQLKLIKEPLSLLRPSRGRIFLNLYHTTPEVDEVKLSKALIEAKEFSCLDLLSSRVSRLSDKELNQLEELIKDQPDTPASFRTAVQRAIAAQPKKGSWKNLWGLLGGGHRGKKNDR